MTRFNRRGNTGVYFVADGGFADYTAPTSTEINGGTALHDVIAAMNGFSSDVGDLTVGDLGSTWDGTIPGGESPAASSITFWAGDDDADTEETVRAALPEGDLGYIAIVKRAKTADTSSPVDVFPVRIKASNDDYGNAVQNAAGQFVVGFSIYDPPAKNAVPAT